MKKEYKKLNEGLEHLEQLISLDTEIKVVIQDILNLISELKDKLKFNHESIYNDKENEEKHTGHKDLSSIL